MRSIVRQALVPMMLAGSLALMPASARADQDSPPRSEQEPTVNWSNEWPRVRLIEVANIVALTVGSIAINASPVPKNPSIKGPVLFDNAARSFFRSPSARVQELAGNWSDNIYHGMVIAPYIVDNYIVALGVHQNADVALQMTLIDMQSLGLSGVMSLAAEHAVGRPRPYVRDCGPGPFAPDKVGFNRCDGVGDNQSFYSGHAAAAFTMAGLTCVHHQHLPLYGGGLPDALACFTTLALATTTGVLRLVVDRHWASDVLIGTAVGLANGYLVPSWLHYGFGSSHKSATIMKTSFGYVAPLPQLYEGGAGLGVVGAF